LSPLLVSGKGRAKSGLFNATIEVFEVRSAKGAAGTNVALLLGMKTFKHLFFRKASAIVFLGLIVLAFAVPSLMSAPQEETAMNPTGADAETVGSTAEVVDALTPAIKEVTPENASAPSDTAQKVALADEQNRLAEEFDIPKGMEERVAFWLDIYSRYDSKHYVIHHREYPWIVFDTIDSTEIFKQKRVTWLNRKDADTLAAARKESILATLKMLQVRSNYEGLPAEETRIFNLLKDIPGTRKKVLREAIVATRIQLGQKDMFEMGLVRSAPFIPMMEQIFEAKGLPKELVRIPLVESSFNIEARSRVGASGAWQIMPSQGRKAMLIDASIDERNSPLKATQFAAFLLKQNKQILKNWPLSVTAWNHGTGSLLKAIRALKTSELQQIIERNSSKSFQFASSNFYACFLAALRGEVYAKELFPDLQRPEPQQLSKVRMTKRIAFATFAKKVGYPMSDLQALNPDLPPKVRGNFILPAGFNIYIPSERVKSGKTLSDAADAPYTVTDFKLQPATLPEVVNP
jgi:membrane-bound lytic murein transglycosylase D